MFLFIILKNVLLFLFIMLSYSLINKESDSIIPLLLLQIHIADTMIDKIYISVNYSSNTVQMKYCPIPTHVRIMH